ncbi:hypothetical protein MNBD_UNCLBAC01-615 [hydrothermal vent metagenome]|uniref:SpoVT-AbrB domain-containing protein n=1 Tax=hydrothermal vent metagenome TaxID=652676 RepID=A0A3B1DER7_9ZZZZ
MKIGSITKANEKGQVVIPKEIRDTLGIDSGVSLNLLIRGKGIYIYPVVDVIGAADEENAYLKILEQTRGTWKEEDSSLRKKKRAVELKASKDRKHAW